MASGVTVDDRCLQVFQELKLKKAFSYIVYKLSDDYTTIEVEKLAEADEDVTYDDFVDNLPESDCRYAIYDMHYQKSAQEGMRSKICFFSWSPDSARIKHKMLYASSKDALRKRLMGVGTEIQGTDMDEISFETVMQRICSV